MHYSSILATLVIAITSVQAGCYRNYYNTANSWERNEADARYHAERACKGWNDNGHKIGAFENVYFRAQWESSAPATVCVNANMNGRAKHYIFQIPNLGAGKTLNPDDCTRMLFSEIDGCGGGGERSYGTGNWWARADPEPGNCSDMSLLNVRS